MKIFHSFNSIREFAAKRDNILFIASLFFLSSVVLLYRYYLVPPLFEIEPDSYYHAMMGYLFQDVWNLKTFYWTSFSIWENCYYDKEWLFHFLLNMLYRWKSFFFNLDWSDFPFLFYTSPQFRYAVGLDPFFGAAKYPDRMAAIEKFRTSKEMILSPEELAKITGARFVFVSRRHAANAKKMLENGFQTSYYSIDGWLFDLAISPKKEIY